jgi:hypothetical protein
VTLSPTTLPTATRRKNPAGHIVARIASIGVGAIMATTFSLQPWNARKRTEAASDPCQTLAPGAPAAADSAGAAAPRAEFHTLYLVGAEEDALRMQADIDAANALRATRGEGPLRVTVIVVTSDAEAEDFTHAFEDGDLTPGRIGRTEYSVIDLRRD